MSKPAVVIIPGSWHCPQHYARLVDELVKAGYEAEAVSLPSVGSSPPLLSWDKDADAVRDVVMKYLDAEKNVVALAHSFGGIAMSEGVKDLGQEDRDKKGLKGAVVRLFYMCAVVLPEGLTYNELIWPKSSQENELAEKEQKKQRENMGMKAAEDGSLVLDPKYARYTFYNRCSQSDCEEAIALLKSYPPGPLSVPVTYTAFAKFPSTYIICKNDKAILEPWQRKMIAQGKGAFTVEICEEGHSPFLSNPSFIVNCVRRGC